MFIRGGCISSEWCLKDILMFKARREGSVANAGGAGAMGRCVSQMLRGCDRLSHPA